MMGRCKGEQGQLFYAFDLEAVVPDDHQVRRIAASKEEAGRRYRLCGCRIKRTDPAPKNDDTMCCGA